MRVNRRVGPAFPVVLVLAAAACGSPSKTIDTKAALAVFRHAGFTSVAVVSAKDSARQVARQTGRPSLAVNVTDADWIYTPGYNLVEMPLSAARLPSVGAAERRYANDQPLLHGKLSADERSVAPRGFRADRLREVRVCNVVVSSYNADRDRTLARRFDRAVALLRARC